MQRTAQKIGRGQGRMLTQPVRVGIVRQRSFDLFKKGDGAHRLLFLGHRCSNSLRSAKVL